MSQKDTQPSTQTLGAFLRDHREKLHLSLEDATESTKISLPILRAIEEDNYERMPAEAFCRGFYSMYAEFLQLNSEEILTRYLESRGQSSQVSQKQARPPIKKSSHFSSFAEPAAFSPATSLAMLLLAFFVVIVGICWYFNWSPLQYLDTQIATSPTVEEPVQPEVKNSPSAPEALTTVSPPGNGPSVPASIQVLTESPMEIPAIGPYRLEVDFISSGSLKIILDDAPATEKNFTSGDTLQWDVKNKFLLDMPEETSATLRLNGIELPLPEAEDGRRRLVFPEASLD